VLGTQAEMTSFRAKFDVPNLKRANWFPGHMARGNLFRFFNNIYRSTGCTNCSCSQNCEETTEMWLCLGSTWCQSILASL